MQANLTQWGNGLFFKCVRTIHDISFEYVHKAIVIMSQNIIFQVSASTGVMVGDNNAMHMQTAHSGRSC